MPALVHGLTGALATPGRVSDALASSLDVLPTLLALAGVPLPDDREWDGLDLAPVLFGGAAAHHDELYHQDENGNLTAFRIGGLKLFTYTKGMSSCHENGTRLASTAPRNLSHASAHFSPSHNACLSLTSRVAFPLVRR